MNILYVALGSAAGGVCRYLISLLLNASAGFPWGTLLVNILGAFAIGLVTGLLAQGAGAAHADAIRAFAIAGFCGGFTTFSTFSNETFRLIQAGQWGGTLVYVLVSLLGGLLAVWGGSVLAAQMEGMGK